MPKMQIIKRTFLILYWSMILGLASGLMLAGCGRVLDGVGHRTISRK